MRLDATSDPGLSVDARPTASAVVACWVREPIGQIQRCRFRDSTSSGSASPVTFAPRLLSYLRISAVTCRVYPPGQTVQVEGMAVARSRVRTSPGASPTGLAESSSLALRMGRSSQVASHLSSRKRSYHCRLQAGNVSLEGTCTLLIKRLHRRTGSGIPARDSRSIEPKARQSRPGGPCYSGGRSQMKFQVSGATNWRWIVQEETLFTSATTSKYSGPRRWPGHVVGSGSVMVASLQEADLVLDHLIDDAMFLGQRA